MPGVHCQGGLAHPAHAGDDDPDVRGPDLRQPCQQTLQLALTAGVVRHSRR
jgi:hypothetical protein